MLKNTKLFLFIILLLAFTLRFYKLGEIPISLNWDEVSNGYNAYSIAKTARDEYGNFLPLANRSFDDFKPPLYMYLDVPAIVLFGLNNFSARLPSAFFGVLSALLIYLLAKRLLQNERAGVLSALLFTISPWNLHFSRVGFEANLGMFFSLLTFNLFLYSLPIHKENPHKQNKFLLILAAIFAALSLYSYHSTRIFLPLLIFASLIIFRKEFFSLNKKLIILTAFLGLLVALPLVLLTPKEAISKRYETTMLKARTEDLETSISLMRQDEAYNQKFSNVLHNRRIIIALSTFQKYMSHFDINFLFTSGDDNLRHHIKNHGMLYLFQLPLVLYGIYICARRFSKNILLLFAWLVIAPIPAALGDAYPHAIRSYLMLIPLTIFSAVGLLNIVSIGKFKLVARFILVIIIVMSLFNYLHNYLTHYNIEEYSWWQYGYQQAALASIKYKNEYEKVIIDPSFEQGYIFWLFYSKYDPELYQILGSRDHFDKFSFAGKIAQSSHNLYVYPAEKSLSNFNILETIYDPQGKEIIAIGESNN